jgi:ribonuclease HII
MSPLRSNEKEPRMPPCTRVAKSSRTTEARVPSDRAIACSSTSVACAASGAPNAASPGGAPSSPDYVLVDGVNRPPDLRFPSEPIVRGDASSASIAAASIIAKVTRDRVMEELHATYPQYGFDRNRGYWSPAHMDALSRGGLMPVHRLNKGTKRWLGVPPLHRP